MTFAPTRTDTVLSCSHCTTSLILRLRDGDDRPQHRCKDGEIKSFDREVEK